MSMLLNRIASAPDVAHQPANVRNLNRGLRHVRSAGLVALLMVVSWTSVHAQTESVRQDRNFGGLDVEFSAGWDNTVDRSRPVVVSFLIGNYTKDSIDGKLYLFDPDRGHRVEVGDVFLSSGASRQLSTIRDLSDWNECFAELQQNDIVIWRRELALNTGQAFLPYENAALVVNDSTRVLHFPQQDVDAVPSDGDTFVTAAGGRKVNFLTAKTWQIPLHSGGINVVQGMVFPEGASDRDLNDGQWQAVAEWMCLGGAVFLHHESDSILQKLSAVAPLGSEPEFQSDKFTVQRFGLGSVRIFHNTLFSDQGRDTCRAITAVVSVMSSHHVKVVPGTCLRSYEETSQADSGRMMILGFLGLYALFSGGITLLMFRKSRHYIRRYITVVVAVACTASAVLGGVLSMSKGDLRWVTVTQAAAGGAVQVANIDLQSAGGQDTQVVVHGRHADLQSVGKPPPHYYWYNQRQSLPAFTWQPNTAVEKEHSCRVRFPMTPWGNKRLSAQAFNPELRRLDVDLRFEPQPETTVPGMIAGRFSLQIVNHMPFDVLNCQLLLGVSRLAKPAGEPSPTRPEPAVQFQQVSQTESNDNSDGVAKSEDLYQVRTLQLLPAGQTYEVSFDAGFYPISNIWELTSQWAHRTGQMARLPCSGIQRAWIIGTIAESSELRIDEQATNFVPREETHLFIQEILAEEMTNLLTE